MGNFQKMHGSLALLLLVIVSSEAIRCQDCRETHGNGCSKQTECDASFDACYTLLSRSRGEMISFGKSCGVRRNETCGQTTNLPSYSTTIRCCFSDLCNAGYLFGNTNSSGETTGLECHQCAGEKGSTCFDNPKESSVTSCSSTYNTCYSTVASEYVVRQCGFRHSDICGKDLGQGTTFCCDTDKCNIATSFTVSAALLAFGLLATSMFTTKSD